MQDTVELQGYHHLTSGHNFPTDYAYSYAESFIEIKHALRTFSSFLHFIMHHDHAGLHSIFT